MQAFSERPHDDRFAALTDLDKIGPCAFSYSGTGITITVPRCSYTAVTQWAARYRLNPRDWYYFPLGSDRVPEVMRHDGNYPGSRGFHLYVHCVPVE